MNAKSSEEQDRLGVSSNKLAGPTLNPTELSTSKLMAELSAYVSLAIGVVLVVIWLGTPIIRALDHSYVFGPRPCDTACFSSLGLQLYGSVEDAQFNSYWLAVPGFALGVIAKVFSAPSRKLATTGVVLCILMPVLIYVGIVFGGIGLMSGG